MICFVFQSNRDLVSGTRNGSQRYEIDQFCKALKGIVSGIQPSRILIIGRIFCWDDYFPGHTHEQKCPRWRADLSGHAWKAFGSVGFISDDEKVRISFDFEGDHQEKQTVLKLSVGFLLGGAKSACGRAHSPVVGTKIMKNL